MTKTICTKCWAEGTSPSLTNTKQYGLCPKCKSATQAVDMAIVVGYVKQLITGDPARIKARELREIYRKVRDKITEHGF